MSTQPLRRFSFGFLLTLIAAAAIGCGDSGSGGQHDGHRHDYCTGNREPEHNFPDRR